MSQPGENLSGKIDQLIDSGAGGRNQRLYLFGREITRAEGVRELLVAQAREQLTHPFGLLDGNIFEEVGVFTAIGELHTAAFDSLYELGLGVVFGVIAA